MFYVDPRGPDIDAARKVCAWCPVRLECLRAAMRWEGSRETRYRFGMWGGLTPLERQRLYVQVTKERRARRAQQG